MIDSPQALVQELVDRGLVADNAPRETVPPATERPWYIGLLLGTAGWFAGIFVLIFVGAIFSLSSGKGALVIGPVLLGAAFALFKVDREGAFVSQLALALSIAGQFAFLFGFADLFVKGSREIASIALIALILQVALVVAMPNWLHRVMSAFFAVIAWAVLVRFAMWDEPTLFSSSRNKTELSTGLAMAGWATVWLPVAGLLYLMIRREAEWIARGWQEIVRPAAAGLIVGLAITTLLSQPFESFPWSSAAATQDGRVIWPLLSTFAALGAIVAAFALGNRGLTAICVIAALGHLSHFYYTLGTSLLNKSLTMIVTGAILLWMARSLKRST